jgi:tRNA pseudouridine55 synthase
VQVHELDVESVGDGRATLRVVCGKGTYVRTLAADLGEALGTGAAVEQLTRLRVGPFTIDSAVTWDLLERAPAESLRMRIDAPEAALAGWVEARLDAAAATAFRHGQAVESPGTPAGLVRVHDSAGTLVGVGTIDAERGRLQPIRILHADRPDARVLPA